MRFYTQQHQYYCGIDLHACSMYLCILNQAGEVLLHRTMRANPDVFRKAVAPYRDDLVVAVECMFTWYWLAELYRSEQITFVLGHARYMKAIHGGKAKNDRIDALKIVTLLRVREAAHLPQQSHWVVDRFEDPSVHKPLAVDLALLAYYDQLLRDLEYFILRTAKEHDHHTLYRKRETRKPVLSTYGRDTGGLIGIRWHCHLNPRLAWFEPSV